MTAIHKRWRLTPGIPTAIAVVAIAPLAVAQAPSTPPRAKAVVDICVDLRAYPHPSGPSEEDANASRARFRIQSDLQRIAPPSAHLEVRHHEGSSCVSAIVEGAAVADAMRTCSQLATRYAHEGPTYPVIGADGPESAVSINQPCRPYSP